MKLIGKYIDKTRTVSSRCVSKPYGSRKQGHVTLRPEDDEDMWHLYNLIQQDDLVRAFAVRYESLSTCHYKMSMMNLDECKTYQRPVLQNLIG